MKIQNVVIAGVVVVGLYWLYTKSKKSGSTSTEDGSTGINGAQWLAYQKEHSNASGVPIDTRRVKGCPYKCWNGQCVNAPQFCPQQ